MIQIIRRPKDPEKPFRMGLEVIGILALVATALGFAGLALCLHNDYCVDKLIELGQKPWYAIF